MKRALYLATKLNSRDIQKCNNIVLGYLPMIRLFASARKAILGNLRWRRFRGDGDRTGRESLELRQPSLPVKNRTLRSQGTQKDGAFN